MLVSLIFCLILCRPSSPPQVMEAGGGWGKLLEDRPPAAVLLEVQKYVRDRLVKKWLPLFLATPEFAIRQHPQINMDEVVDDVLVQKRRRSQAVWKVSGSLLYWEELHLFPSRGKDGWNSSHFLVHFTVKK